MEWFMQNMLKKDSPPFSSVPAFLFPCSVLFSLLVSDMLWYLVLGTPSQDLRDTPFC